MKRWTVTHKDRKPRRRACGFTLIEVVVALAIVAIGMSAAILAVGQTASDSTYLRDKTLAHWVAMNRLTEVRLQPRAPAIDETSDEVEMAGRKWHWTMTVTQTPVQTMQRIDISVRPEDAPEGSSLAFVTGFYGTAIAPPGSAIVLWEGEARPDGAGPETDEPKPDDGDKSGEPDAPPEDSGEPPSSDPESSP
jgi:general secretion pathway protein I